MFIAIISDSHDNLPNLEKCLTYLAQQGVSTIIHCGDITSAETLEYIGKHFDGEVHVVYGNGDYMQEELNDISYQYDNVIVYGDEGEIEINNLKIAWNHFPEVARTQAASGEYDAVFHGHTHIPWEEKVGKCIVRNPGPLSGLRNKATFALLDTETNVAQLLLLEKI